MLPRDIPLYCLPCHAANLTERGFSKVVPIDGTVAWEGIRITRTPGEHAGNEKWKKILGPVTGFFLEAQGEPKIYWAGDTILNDKVVNQIKTLNPDIILTHSCGAFLEDSGPIVMDAKMTIDVCRLAPDAVVVATHMEALDHASVTRKDLRALADREGVSREHLLIPADGEILKF